MSSYDEEFLAAVARNGCSKWVKALDLNNAIIDEISGHFPFEGNKVDWSKMPVHLDGSDWVNEADFVQSVLGKYGLGRPILYVGDNLTDRAYEIETVAIFNLLPDILLIPQHNYLFPRDFSWLFCFSFEGDMDFGASVDIEHAIRK